MPKGEIPQDETQDQEINVRMSEKQGFEIIEPTDIEQYEEKNDSKN